MAFTDRFGSRVLSQPIKLHWAGWETDTYKLQRAGWEISAAQDIQYRMLRLAIQHREHEAQAHLMFPHHDYYGLAAGSGTSHMTHAYEGDCAVVMGRQIMVEAPRSIAEFSPIDATPQIIHDGRFSRLEDIAHFASALAQTQQIIVDEPSVDDLLAQILERQQAAKTKHFQDAIRAQGVVPRFTQHAQIISLRDAA